MSRTDKSCLICKYYDVVQDSMAKRAPMYGAETIAKNSAEGLLYVGRPIPIRICLCPDNRVVSRKAPNKNGSRMKKIWHPTRNAAKCGCFEVCEAKEGGASHKKDEESYEIVEDVVGELDEE